MSHGRTMLRMLFAGVLLATLLITSTTVRAADYQPGSIHVPEGKSIIVVYRKFVMTGAAWPHHIYVDKQHVIGLKSRAYTFIVVQPGSHTVTAGPKSNPESFATTITAKAGTVHFVRYLPETLAFSPGYVPAQAELQQMGAVEAEQDIMENKYKYQAPLIVDSN